MRVILLPAARDDLRAIWRFGLEHWSMPQADRYSGALDAAIESLANDPERAARFPGAGRGYRRLIAGSHAVNFRIEGEAVIVVRVLHQSARAKGWV